MAGKRYPPHQLCSPCVGRVAPPLRPRDQELTFHEDVAQNIECPETVPEPFLNAFRPFLDLNETFMFAIFRIGLTILRPFFDLFSTFFRPFLDFRPFFDHFSTIFRPICDHFSTILRPLPTRGVTPSPKLHEKTRTVSEALQSHSLKCILLDGRSGFAFPPLRKESVLESGVLPRQ